LPAPLLFKQSAKVISYRRVVVNHKNPHQARPAFLNLNLTVKNREVALLSMGPIAAAPSFNVPCCALFLCAA
jgi:hypothetical protein